MIADSRLLRRFWMFLRPHRRWLWLALLLMPVAVLCQLAGPLIIKYAIDEHLLTGNASQLPWDVLMFLGVLVGEYAGRMGERFALIRCGILTLRGLRRSLMDHLTRQPVSSFERRPLGTLVSRVTSDVEALMETLSTGVVTIISDVVMLTGIVIAMAWLNLRLTLVTIAMVIPVGLMINWYRRRLRADYDKVRRHTGRMNGVLNETVVGMREMQLFQYQSVMQRRFAESNAAYFRDNMRIVGFDAVLYSIVEGMGILTIAAMAWYGVRLVMAEVITIGVLVAFLTYIQRFYTPIKEFSAKLAILQGGLAAMNRVVELLDRDERQPWGTAVAGTDGSRVPSRDEPSVRFDGVWFVYPQRLTELSERVSGGPPEAALDEPPGEVPGADGGLERMEVAEPAGPDGLYALRGVSFSVSPGERMAIVGRTGSGKSTVVKLLAGLYRPRRGRVLMDGRVVTSYAQEAFQRRVGVVTQDVHLFADTIAFNVGLGNPRLGRAQIEEACRIVQADGFIQKLTDGYDTIIEAGGRNLSQGQQQLLAFARILAASPDLVILDEATANVDSHSERLIQKAILEVLRRKTTIVIAHRLATVRHVGRIVVLHEGRAVESGTHEALLAKRGYYHDLVNSEFVPQVA